MRNRLCLLLCVLLVIAIVSACTALVDNESMIYQKDESSEEAAMAEPVGVEQVDVEVVDVEPVDAESINTDPINIKPIGQPESVLFVGNACTEWGHGVPSMFEAMMVTTDPSSTLRIASASAYGGDTDETFGPGLERLWEIPYIHYEIKNGHYDIVIVQGDITADPECDPSSFTTYAKMFKEEIESVGSEMVLLMAWTRPNADCIDADEIARLHRSVAEELHVPVIPVGVAWERALEEGLSAALLDMDGIHQCDIGNYLSTCVIYSSLYGESPVGLSFRPANLYPDPESVELPAYRQEIEVALEILQLSDEDAETLQRIAWDSVQEWQQGG